MTTKCYFPGCGQEFANHGELITHVFRDHGRLRGLKAISTVALASSLLAASLTVFAAEERHLPDARPDGKMCQAVTGGIRGMTEDFSPVSGTTYYTSTHAKSLEAPLVITQDFAVSLYDADGGYTTVTFHNPTPNAPSETLQFSGTNDTWAQTYTVTQHVDSVHIDFPKSHYSTHICLMEIAESATVTEPTGLNPVLEPAKTNHVFLPMVVKS